VMVASCLYLGLGDDELPIAGALLGEPLEVARTARGDLLVPAHCECVLEGTLDSGEPFMEGPVSEFHGMYESYGAGVVATFTRVTRRRDAIFQVILPGYHAEHCLLGGVAIAAGFTSFYSWRLVFMTFFGERGQFSSWLPPEGHEVDANAHDEAALTHPAPADHAHGVRDDTTAHPPHDDHGHGHGAHPAHESPLVMLVPLAILGLGAVFAGVAFRHWFIGSGYSDFWRNSLFLGQENDILERMEHVPTLVSLSPNLFMIVGLLIAYYLYIVDRKAPERLAAIFPGLYQFLLNKWYFDELYDFLFVRPAFAIGRLFWKGGDGAIIDGLGPDGVSARVLDVTRGAVKLQSGFIYQYAFAMLLGVAALATWYLFGGGR